MPMKVNQGKIKHHHLEENTTFIDKATTRRQLFIKEGLIINKNKPSINIQYSCFSQVLKLYSGGINNNYNSPSSKQDISSHVSQSISEENENINLDKISIPAKQSGRTKQPTFNNPPLPLS